MNTLFSSSVIEVVINYSQKGILRYKFYNNRISMQKSTIALSVETKNRLKSQGAKDQSYDELINVILDIQEHGVNQ